MVPAAAMSQFGVEPRRDLRFVEIIYYLRPSAYGQTLFWVVQLLTVLAAMAFSVLFLWALVSTATALHRLWLIATVFASVCGALGVLGQFALLALYIIGRSSQMSHRHNGPVYLGAAFSMVLLVLIGFYQFAWCVGPVWEGGGCAHASSDPPPCVRSLPRRLDNWSVSVNFTASVIDFAMPRESQFRQYQALLVSGLVFTVFVQYVLVRSILAHWNPEGQEITTDPRCLPQIVAIFKSPGSRERHQRRADDAEKRDIDAARHAYESGEGQALLALPPTQAPKRRRGRV